MIRSYQDQDTERVFRRIRVPRFSPGTQRAALQKLLILDAADRLDDLRIPPGNRLEKLAGRRQGQYRVRINDQWRVCFRWRSADALEVEITDYH